MQFRAPSTHLGVTDRYITPPTNDSSKSAYTYGPYTIQEDFPYGRFSVRTHKDPLAVTVLQDAVALGRLLGLSDRGLSVAAYVLDLDSGRAAMPSLDHKGIGRYRSPTKELIRRWFAEDRVFYTCRYLHSRNVKDPDLCALVPGGQEKDGPREVVLGLAVSTDCRTCIDGARWTQPVC